MSKVEVDQVTQQSGTTLTVGGGACKTAVVDATTVTLGRCGGTVSLASGATQSGFGRTGTVDWQTTPKTTTFTAVNGEGYFCNTGGGAFTCNLPAGTAGAIVSVQDYNNTFDTAQLTIQGNGSDKINGGTAGGLITLSTEGQGLTLVYVDSTVGWRSIEEQSYATAGTIPTYIVASVSGACNTLTTAPDCSNVKVAKFVNPGTFTVCSVGNPSGSDTVDYLVIAGGASGGNGGAPSGGSGTASAGGGAGGYRFSDGTASGCYSAGPTPLGASALPVSATGYPITVGGGGAVNGPTPAAGQQGNPGDTSIFSTITSAGGGTGGGWSPTPGSNGVDGGSGGGASQSGSAGAGNTPSVSPPQGNPGGTSASPNGAGGGGGGVTGAGGNGTAANPQPCNSTGGAGGTGATSAIDGTPTGRGGGGSGGVGGDLPVGPPGTVGPVSDGGGAGGNIGVAGSAGTIYTGGGGGGGGANPGKVGGAGGSGIVVIRYRYQ